MYVGSTNIPELVYVEWFLTGSSVWVSSGHSGFLPQLSGKWLKDYEIGYGKDQAPYSPSRAIKLEIWIGLQNHIIVIDDNTVGLGR